MKKLLCALVLIGGMWPLAFAGDSICTDWGKFEACVPVTTGVDAAFGYDFRGHHSQGLAETAFARWNVSLNSTVAFKFGGITTENGKGAPFFGVDYELKGIENPIPGIANVHPGIYGGKDFHTNEWFYGVKASIPIIQ